MNIARLLRRIPRADVRHVKDFVLEHPFLSRIGLFLLLPFYALLMPVQIEFWRDARFRDDAIGEGALMLQMVFLPWRTS